MDWNRVMNLLWYYISNLGMSIPFISYAFCYLLNALFTIKVKKNKLTCFIPLIAGLVGILLAIPENVFLPAFKLWQTRMLMGFFLGLSAVGMHQIGKKLKLYSQLRKLEKNQKVKNIET